MNEQFIQLWQKYRAFPRAVQWAVAAAIVILVFVIWNDYIKAIGDRWAMQADTIQQQVKTVRDSRALVTQFEQMKPAIMTIGQVEPPSTEKQTSDALNTIKDKIIEKYRSDITKESFQRTAGDRIRKGALFGIIGPGEIGQKLSGEFEFESTPETATKIIAELEKNPDVEAVSEVRITKIGNRRISVKLKIEAWVVGRDTKART